MENKAENQNDKNQLDRNQFLLVFICHLRKIYVQQS